MAETEYGTRADELTRALECGPPYVVRYTWAGGFGGRERDVVAHALAACFGVETLSGEQTIAEPQGVRDPLPDRVKYLFWLLRVFDLSLGFTHGWEDVAARSTTTPPKTPARVYRFTVRVDRSRHRASYDD